MTGPAPDLAALREAVGLYLDPVRAPARPTSLTWPVAELDAVLALVDTLQGENQRLRDALAEYGGHQDRCATETVWGRGPCNCGWPETLDALSVPPAEKEPPCPACGGKGEVVDGIDQHGGDSFWTCMRCGGSGQEPS